MKNGETWGHSPEDEYEGSFKQMSEDKLPEADQADDMAPEGARTPEGDAEVEKDYTEAFDEAEKPAESAPETDEFDAAAEEAMKPIAGPEPKTFKEAFAKARADGLKVFDWNGKKYTTQMKGTQNPAPANPVKPAAPAVESVVKKKPAAPKIGLNLTDVPVENKMLSEGKPSVMPKEEPKKMSAMDVKPLAAADDAPSIYREFDRKPAQSKSPDLSPVGKVVVKG